MKSSLRQTFLEADTRGLAVFRIVFGAVMLGYLFTRTTGDSLVAYHTNDGLLPNHYVLFAPVSDYQWSLLFAVSNRPQVIAAFLAMGFATFCFMIGYRTRLATIFSLASLISLHYRNSLMVNGSMVMMHVMCLWTMALPLGRHYSVDAYLARRSGIPQLPLPNERITSLAVLGFRLQLFCVYFFNVVHKTGETWRDGSAVHFVLWQDRITMWPAVWLREHETAWLSPAASYGTLVVESVIALAVLSPFAPRFSRWLAAALMLLLHGGIGLLVNLGPFPFVFPSAALLLLANGDWSGFPAFAKSRIFRGPLARFAEAVLADGPTTASPAGASADAMRWLRVRSIAREGYYAALLLTIALLMRNDNPWLNKHLGPFRLPEPARIASAALYIPQGWSLFAPEAPKQDGMLVVDAVRWDGSHIDPLTHERPDFRTMEHGPFHTDYFWQTYVPRIVMSQSPDLWRFFVDYMERIPVIEGWPGDPRFRSIRVYYVGGPRPKFGEPVPPAPDPQLFAERVYVPEAVSGRIGRAPDVALPATSPHPVAPAVLNDDPRLLAPAAPPSAPAPTQGATPP